jgi:hypothetical protein
MDYYPTTGVLLPSVIILKCQELYFLASCSHLSGPTILYAEQRVLPNVPTIAGQGLDLILGDLQKC